MAGYRCVNFNDLCRLCCSSASAGTSAAVQIFSTDGLQRKIIDCLSITLNENDKLPKVICASCKEYVDVFTEFRKTSKNAQKMLEGCLNTSKLRNGGQVYIKDETPVKKVLKPIQNPSPTKIVPNLNLCNIIATTPTKQAKKNIITSPSQPDFLSSIMQAVGIQAGEEVTEGGTATQQNVQHQTIPVLPQYTLTLDTLGNTLKSGPIQYKIENAGNILSQTPLLTAKNIQDIQNQQIALNQVDEFLKLKQKPGLIVKKDIKSSALTLTSNQAQSKEPKDNKQPKFNLIVQATKQTPTKVQQPQIVSPQPKTTTTSYTSPNKAQILNIEKILPITNQTSPTKQLVVPIMVRNDGSGNAVVAGNDAASQIFSKALSMTASQNMENKAQAPQQPVLVQMKIQSNADGQVTLTPIQSSLQQPLQLALCPQQLQTHNFQAIAQQQQPTLALQPTQLNLQQSTPTNVTIAASASAPPPPTPVSTAQDIQTQTALDDSKGMKEDDDDMNGNYEDDDYMHTDENEEVLNEVQPKVQVIKKSSPNKKTVKTIKPSKVKTKSNDSSLTELQTINAEHSEMAKKQLNQLTNYNNKRAEAENAAKNNEINLTVCDVCKKIFKRKEFLMQHLKSHIGLRPFKCTSCNKAFSRKEHLLRHISSHTGTKEFICNVCNKLFSRKDNLNKHRRIHPENGQQNAHTGLNCQNCDKEFPTKLHLVKHQAICDNKETDRDNDDEDDIPKEPKEKASPPPLKKLKMKVEKNQEIIKRVQNPVSSQQPKPQKIVQILQTQQPQVAIKSDGQQLMTLSMSQAQTILSQQAKSSGIYTFPTNFVLNANGTINELKFDPI